MTTQKQGLHFVTEKSLIYIYIYITLWSIYNLEGQNRNPSFKLSEVSHSFVEYNKEISQRSQGNIAYCLIPSLNALFTNTK